MVNKDLDLLPALHLAGLRFSKVADEGHLLHIENYLNIAASETQLTLPAIKDPTYNATSITSPLQPEFNNNGESDVLAFHRERQINL